MITNLDRNIRMMADCIISYDNYISFYTEAMDNGLLVKRETHLTDDDYIKMLAYYSAIYYNNEVRDQCVALLKISHILK